MKLLKKIVLCGMGMLLSATALTTLQTTTISAASEDTGQGETQMSNLEKEGLFPSVDKDGNITYVKVEGNDISEELKLPEETDKSTTFDLKLESEDGEAETIATYDTFEEANAAMMRRSMFRSNSSVAVYTDDQLRSVTNGVVNFNTKSCGVYTSYTEEGTNLSGGINGCYGADAAYLGTSSDGTKVKFKMAGVTGWVNKSDVQILNFDTNDVLSVSYYEVYGDRIYHNITTNVSVKAYASTVDVGPRQSYLNNGEYYYSYDGHYFYDTYAQMIVDYKNNSNSHAVNAGNPYYNYYQYLSFRSKTNMSAADLNSVAQAVGGQNSKMVNQGANYITHQNTYGANALLTFGVSANESAWGKSDYAQYRNNLFGIEAYDSNPDMALKFNTVSDSIKKFMQTYVSITYLDPIDVGGLYHGSCLGDKSIGMGTKYATAPYWGETNATHSYTLEKRLGKSDVDKYTIGIKSTTDSVNIRKEPNTSSTTLYKTGAWNNYPFLILDTVKGESVNGNTTWYKIATDAPLSNDRSKALQFMVDKGGEYNASVSYAYVSATLVDIVNDGGIDGGVDGGTDPSTPYSKGDVNGNGKIDAADYLMIMDNILGKYSMNESQKKAADVNGNGKVDAADYLMTMDHILGKITIK